MMTKLINPAYFEEHRRVLVAVSGGQDSMALLHLLYVSRETLGIELGIAHVNHGQRPESQEEEAYLRQLADELGLAFYVAHFSGEFNEAAGRDFRYQFFSRIMAEQGYTALVTAHHRDDQVETIFHRILRGSRLRHVTGMSPVQSFGPGQLIRPLLEIKKSDLPQVFHFEDQSNKTLTYTRNRIRLTYLPELRTENPNLDQCLLDLAEESRLVYQAVRDLTAGLEVTDLAVFQAQTQAVQSVLLQDYLAHFSDLQLSKPQFAQVLHILNTKANYRHPLKSGYWLVKDYDQWSLQKLHPETDDQDQSLVLHYGESVNFSGFFCDFSENQHQTNTYPLPSSSALLLRQPKPGDKMQLGSYHKKLSRLFIDDKIPASERQQALVVEQDGEIQLVRVADKTYLRKDPKHAIMKFNLSIDRRGDTDVRTRH